MRAFWKILIVLCFSYFPIGFILTKYQIIELPSFLNLGGVVGSIASILGLLSLSKPGISNEEIKQIEANYLVEVANAAETLKNLEIERGKTKEEIGNLENKKKEIEIQKKEMEFLVKKATLKLFLEEQENHIRQKIIKFISENQELGKNLNEYDDLGQKLKSLNSEIENDPNIELLNEIITASRKRRNEIDELLEISIDMPFTGILLRSINASAKIFSKTIENFFFKK